MRRLEGMNASDNEIDVCWRDSTAGRDDRHVGSGGVGAVGRGEATAVTLSIGVVSSGMAVVAAQVDAAVGGALGGAVIGAGVKAASSTGAARRSQPSSAFGRNASSLSPRRLNECERGEPRVRDSLAVGAHVGKDRPVFPH